MSLNRAPQYGASYQLINLEKLRDIEVKCEIRIGFVLATPCANTAITHVRSCTAVLVGVAVVGRATIRIDILVSLLAIITVGVHFCIQIIIPRLLSIV